MKRSKIIYISPGKSTFIQKDIDILSEEYLVKQFYFNASKKIYTPILFIIQLLYLLKELNNCKAFISRFAGYHSLLPALLGKVFNKKSITIVGGTDCHKFPAYKYGSFNKKLLSLFLKLTYRYTDIIAPVHESLIESNYTYHYSGKPKQGLKFFYPITKAKINTIYNGYDTRKFTNKNLERGSNTFITVASGIDGNNYYIKGIDLIIECARYFPDCTFTIVGIKNFNDNRLKRITSNINLKGYLSTEELIALYNQHEFYLQLSIAEGFPNALCEAMLCGCIPIGSDVFGIPFIIDDCGFILKEKNTNQLIELINNAKNCDKKLLALKSRERIEKNFPIGKRKEKLLQIINS